MNLNAINVKYGITESFRREFSDSVGGRCKRQGIGEAVYLSIPYNYKIIIFSNVLEKAWHYIKITAGRKG